ncbi:hypothetical protein N311_09720, partial [Apaloderma vittatum]
LEALSTLSQTFITSQLLLEYHPHHYFLWAEHFSSSESPRQKETRQCLPVSASACRHINHDGNYPCPVGNTAGHFCCSADNEFPHASAARCGGDLENEACAADLAAWLCVSQPRYREK